jgi:hypothetical protein
MVEKTEREILDGMADEQEMLEFFESNHKAEVEMGKMKILHAYHALLDGIDKLYAGFTKGMTKEQIKEWQEIDEDDDESEWASAFSVMEGEIEKRYNYAIDIDVDEYSVTISNYLKFFRIEYNTTISKKRPKLSEMEFEVELTDEAHFFIDLCNKLILTSKEEE